MDTKHCILNSVLVLTARDFDVSLNYIEQCVYCCLLSLILSAYVILHRSCMLQADSEKLRQAWIKAVQTSIATAYREKGDESEVSLKIKHFFLNFED